MLSNLLVLIMSFVCACVYASVPLSGFYPLGLTIKLKLIFICVHDRFVHAGIDGVLRKYMLSPKGKNAQNIHNYYTS